MLSIDQYERLKVLCEDNHELSSLVETYENMALSDISFASHEIKNKLAYLKTSIQLIEKKTPEATDNKYWNNMTNTLEDIINYMKRLSLYRYSYKNADKSEVNLSSVLYSLPDLLDERIDEVLEETPEDKIDTASDFSFDVEDNLIVKINEDQLTCMLLEVLVNACEAATSSDTINIASKKINPSEVTITISNPGVSEFDINQAVLPFFTTKEKHAGLGLSILHQTCLLNNGKYSVDCSNGITSVSITLPLF